MLLDKVKLILGITSTNKDDILLLLLEQATEEALNYTHREFTEGLENTIVQMAVVKYNRLGSEGLDSEGYSGVSFDYSSDYPDAIVRALKSKRKLISL